MSAQPAQRDLAYDEALSQEPTRPLRRVEYEALVEAGHLVGEPIELIDGRLVEVSPEGAQHSATIWRLHRLLTFALGDRAWARAGNPFAASDVSEPEPDICVVQPGDYDREHPGSAILTVEVAYSSIRRDRVVKSRIYAAAGVPEYWIVDLTNGTVIVMRDPSGAEYVSTEIRRRGQRVEPAAFPDVSLALDEFLPPADLG